MKIVAFVGSAHKNGNTATAVKALLAGAADNAETRTVYLYDYVIKPCTGCRVCEKIHQCIIKDDDVPAIHELIREADAYVLATPTYYGDITGQFKQFVDRVYPFIDIKKDEKTQKLTFGSIVLVRKPGVLVAVSGSHAGRVFDSHIKVAYHCLNDINGYLWRDVLIPHTTWTPVADMPDTLETLRQTGRELVAHWQSGVGEDLARTQWIRENML